MADVITPCPNCGSNELYTARTAAGGAYGPHLLPGLGGWWSTAEMNLVVCADCGLTRIFASQAARDKLPESRHWTRCDFTRP